MGFTPPPPPIKQAEFERRYRAGARTLEEVDPVLFQWRDRNRSFRRIGYWAMGLAVACAVVVSLAVALGMIE